MGRSYVPDVTESVNSSTQLFYVMVLDLFRTIDALTNYLDNGDSHHHNLYSSSPNYGSWREVLKSVTSGNTKRRLQNLSKLKSQTFTRPRPWHLLQYVFACGKNWKRGLLSFFWFDTWPQPTMSQPYLSTNSQGTKWRIEITAQGLLRVYNSLQASGLWSSRVFPSLTSEAAVTVPEKWAIRGKYQLLRRPGAIQCDIWVLGFGLMMMFAINLNPSLAQRHAFFYNLRRTKDLESCLLVSHLYRWKWSWHSKTYRWLQTRRKSYWEREKNLNEQRSLFEPLHLTEKAAMWSVSARFSSDRSCLSAVCESSMFDSMGWMSGRVRL